MSTAHLRSMHPTGGVALSHVRKAHHCSSGKCKLGSRYLYRVEPFTAASRQRLCKPCWSAPNDPQETSEPQSSNPRPSPPSAPVKEGVSNAQKILATAQALKGEDQPLQISREVIEKMKYSVFGLDTLFVTSVENYEADGVVFKGNLRAKDPGAAYLKMKKRLQAELGDTYKMFLLEDVEGRPTAILLPRERLTPSDMAQGIATTGEVWLALVFGAATIVTSLQANGAPIFDFLSDPEYGVALTQQALLDAAPGAAAFMALLAAHEAGHWWGIQKWGVQSKVSWPLLVPAGFGLLGSFGAVTRIKEALPNRPALLDVTLPGPLVGSALSAVMLVAGFLLTAVGQGDVGIDTPAFADSFLVGLLGQLFIPEMLEKPEALVHPLLLAGWGGLIVNSLHLIPAGDTDGSRIAHAVLGRRSASLLSNLGLASLGISAFFRPLAFLWVLLVAVLLRGPILPQEEEYSTVQSRSLQWGSLALLLLPLLVLVPYPMELAFAFTEMRSPGLTF